MPVMTHTWFVLVNGGSIDSGDFRLDILVWVYVEKQLKVTVITVEFIDYDDFWQMAVIGGGDDGYCGGGD